jgi:hypothetical protein
MKSINPMRNDNDDTSGQPARAKFAVIVPLFNVDFSCDSGKIKQFRFQPSVSAPSDIIFEELTISLFKWARNDPNSQRAIELFCPFESLPHNYDLFDAFPTLQANTILVVEVIEGYTPNTHQKILLGISNSMYADQAVRSFVAALKLYDEKEPHVYKGFYFKNRKSTGGVIHWPIKEMQGPRMTIDTTQLNNLTELFFDLLLLELSHRESTGHRVNLLAQRYYVLSSTQTEYDVIFLFLMIAFEVLLKNSDKESVSHAKRRFGKLLSNKKSDYSRFSKFMSEDPNDKGCCYLRNALVHGDENAESIGSELFWELKKYIRIAIVRLLKAMKTSKVDCQNYYHTLDEFINERFDMLPDT